MPMAAPADAHAVAFETTPPPRLKVRATASDGLDVGCCSTSETGARRRPRTMRRNKWSSPASRPPVDVPVLTIARSRGNGPLCSIASLAAATASWSVRERRRDFGSSLFTSAAMSVGKVSPGNRVSFAIPARASAIDCHTSSLLRPIEQTMPAPVIAIRVEGSGLATAEVEPPAHDVYSIDAAAAAEAKRPAELCFERDANRDDVDGLDRAQHFTAIDAREKSLRLEHEPSRELRHRLDQHHLRRHHVIRGADVHAFDRLLIDACRRARGAKGDLVREACEPVQDDTGSLGFSSTYAASVEIDTK